MASKISLAACVVMALCGCAAPSIPPPEAPLIATRRLLDLPSPGDLGRSVEAVQMITIRHAGRTFAFESHVSVTAQRLTLVGIDGMGRRAITVTWTDDGIATERAAWVPDTVRPGSMIADLVVLYWPEAAVRRALAPAGATLTADGGIRQVRVGDRDLLRAERSWRDGEPWTGTVRYANLAWGYEVEVLSVEVTP